MLARNRWPMPREREMADKVARRVAKAVKLHEKLVHLGLLKHGSLSEKRLAKLRRRDAENGKQDDETKEAVNDFLKVLGKLQKALGKNAGKGVQCPEWLKKIKGEDAGEEKKKTCLKRQRATSGSEPASENGQQDASSTNGEKKSKKQKVVQGVTLLLFYAYVEPEWDEYTHKKVIDWANGVLCSCGVTGRLRVAKEGFNGTLTGSYNGVREFCQSVRDYDPKLFSDVDFKLTDGLPEGQRFPKLNVFAVSELVNYGLAKEKAPSIQDHGGVHLPPPKFHEKLQEPNTVVIDVRNSYEAEIGRFEPPKSGADYIDPKMRLSTEFPDWVDKNLDKLKDKQVLMYCTGGIRCERASAYLRSKGHDKGVFQLQGGIHKYLEQFPTDGGLWVGKNYTFDKRFAHGAPGLDGTERESVVSKCAACDQPWDKYRGRKRCPQCSVPLLICVPCQEKEKHKSALCSLCKEDAKQGRAFQKPGDAAGPKGIGVRQQAKQLKINKCGKCQEVFKSRNALFRHLQETGHVTRNKKRKM